MINLLTKLVINFTTYKKWKKNKQFRHLCLLQTIVKRDKGNLVQFLIKRYDMNYSTINAKLNGRSKMTVLEHDMITNVIDNELWKM